MKLRALSFLLATVVMTSNFNVAYAMEGIEETNEEIIIEEIDDNEIEVIEAEEEVNEFASEAASSETSETFDFGNNATGFVAPEHPLEVTHYDNESDASFDGSDEVASLKSYTTELLPPLRNQNPYGTCWAFASTALVEINLMKKGLMSSPDLSELHLAHFAYRSVVDPLGGTEGDYINDPDAFDLDAGGNFERAFDSYATWIGAADESIAEYKTQAAMVQALGLQDSIAYEDVAHITGCYTEIVRVDQFRSSKDLSMLLPIKKLIYNYGAAGITFGAANGLVAEYDNNIYSKTNNAYYNPNVTTQNHAVVVVGWDDNFSKDKFPTAAPGNGAFLVRNSWTDGSYGDSQSYSGYFWMSYYEGSLGSYFYGIEAELSDNYDNNYQYDGNSGIHGYYSYDAGANVFTAHADGGENGEELKAVSFETSGTNLSYTIEVYKNVGSKLPSGNLVSSATTKGTTTFAGYQTVKLNDSVMLEKGEKFAVVVKLDSDIYALVAPVSCSDTYSKASSQSGQSYRVIGNSWSDIGKNANFSIKAFTDNASAGTAVEPTDITFKNITDGKLELGVEEGFYLQSAVVPSNASKRTITYTSSNSSIAKVSNAGNIIGVAEGKATITATIEGTNISKTIEVTVVNKLLGITVSAYQSFDLVNGGSYIKFEAKTAPSSYVPKEAVKWSSSDERVLRINSKGKAYYIRPGVATVTATLEGKTDSHTYTFSESVATGEEGDDPEGDEENPTDEPEDNPADEPEDEPETDPEEDPAKEEVDDNDWGDVDEALRVYFDNKASNVEAGVWYAIKLNDGTYRVDVRNGNTGIEKEYTGSQIRLDKDVTVFHNTRKLKVNRDYTVTYSNNVKVADAAAAKAPTMMVKGKGNYNSTAVFKFEITAADLESAVITSEKNVTVIAGNTKLSTVKPAVSISGKKLVLNKDYILGYYEGETNLITDPSKVVLSEAGKTYTIRAIAKDGGNYKGVAGEAVTVAVSAKSAKAISVSKLKAANKTGKAISFAYDGNKVDMEALFATGEAVVKNGKTVLSYGTDFEVEALDSTDHTSAGQHRFIVTGKGDYVGEKIFSYAITGTSLKKAKLAGFKTSVEYTGSAIEFADLFNSADKVCNTQGWREATLYTVTDGSKIALTRSTDGASGDYVVSMDNIGDVGKFDVTFTGINGFEGSIKKTVTVKTYSFDEKKKADSEKKLSIVADETVTYSKAGAKPSVTVSFDGRTLTEGIDYTLSYKNNTKIVPTISALNALKPNARPQVIVKGLGNFTGNSATTYFCITRAVLTEDNLVANDVTFNPNGKAGYFLVVPTLEDEGKTLTVGRGKDVEILSKSSCLYTYAAKTTLLDGTIRRAGDEVLASDKVQAGTKIKMSASIVVGDNSPYRASASNSEYSSYEKVYRVLDASRNLSECSASLSESGKKKLVVNNSKEIKLNSSDFVVTYKKGNSISPVPENYYTVESITNNRFVGRATVTLKGTGIYGGRKTVTVKISARSM